MKTIDEQYARLEKLLDDEKIYLVRGVSFADQAGGTGFDADIVRYGNPAQVGHCFLCQVQLFPQFADIDFYRLVVHVVQHLIR